jgi:hypothetical protein
MKTLFLLLTLLAFTDWVALAQPTTQAIPQPDCIILFHFTAVNQTAPTSPNAGLNNLTTGCTVWTVSAAVSGFTSGTVALQSAPNVSGAPGTWVTFAGSIMLSPAPHNVNPIVTSTQDFVWMSGYNPWVRVQLTAVLGSGRVDGAAYGWRRLTTP